MISGDDYSYLDFFAALEMKKQKAASGWTVF